MENKLFELCEMLLSEDICDVTMALEIIHADIEIKNIFSNYRFLYEPISNSISKVYWSSKFMAFNYNVYDSIINHNFELKVGGLVLRHSKLFLL